VILAGLDGGHRVDHVGAFDQAGWTGLIADVILRWQGAARAVPAETCFATSQEGPRSDH